MIVIRKFLEILKIPKSLNLKDRLVYLELFLFNKRILSDAFL